MCPQSSTEVRLGPQGPQELTGGSGSRCHGALLGALVRMGLQVFAGERLADKAQFRAALASGEFEWDN
jgi:hypothetical protein